MLDDAVVDRARQLAADRSRLGLGLERPAHWADLLAESQLDSAERLLRQYGDPCTDTEYALHGALLLQRHLQAVVPLTPPAQRAIGPFALVAAICLLRDPGIALAANSPLLGTLQRALRYLLRVENNPGRAIAASVTALHQRLLAGARDLLFGVDLDKALERFREALKVLESRDQAAASAQELRQAEQRLHRQAHDQLARLVIGQPVPALVVDFLDRCAAPALARAGVAGSSEALWSAVRQLLFWVIDADPAQLQARDDQARSELAARLRLLDASDDFITACEQLLAARARRAPDAGLPLGEWPEPEEEGSNEFIDRRKLGETLVADAWLWPGPDGLRRVGALAAGDEVLPVDALGEPVARAVAVPRFLQAVQAGRVVPLSLRASIGLLNATLEPWLQQWQADLQRQLERQAEAERRRAEREAESHAEAHRQSAAEQRAERIRRARAEAEHRALVNHWQRELAHVLPGAVLQWQGDGQPRACWLQRRDGEDWIFVDRQGQRLRRLATGELIEELIRGDSQWLDSGSSLDEALSGLIQERRQFLQDEG